METKFLHYAICIKLYMHGSGDVDAEVDTCAPKAKAGTYGCLSMRIWYHGRQTIEIRLIEGFTVAI